MGEVADERNGGEAVRANFVEERGAPAAFVKADKRGANVVWQGFGQPEHLPLGATEKRARREVDQSHWDSFPGVAGNQG
jgi:hypothetical protein